MNVGWKLLTACAASPQGASCALLDFLQPDGHAGKLAEAATVQHARLSGMLRLAYYQAAAPSVARD